MRVPHGGDHSDRPPPAERTHLFGSLMSNTDVTVTRTLMMSTATGSRTMRPPKSPDLRLRRRVLAFCLPRHLTLFLRANVFKEQLLPLHISCVPTFYYDIKFHPTKCRERCINSLKLRLSNSNFLTYAIFAKLQFREMLKTLIIQILIKRIIVKFLDDAFSIRMTCAGMKIGNTWRELKIHLR